MTDNLSIDANEALREYRLKNIKLGRHSYIVGDLTNLTNREIIIGNFTSIASLVISEPDHISIPNPKCVTNHSFYFDKSIANKFESYIGGPIHIGHDVWIGKDVYLKHDINIGNGAIIGARAVVTKDVPAYAVVVGNSMRIVRYRFVPEVIEKLQKIQWWDWPDDKIVANADYFMDIDNFIQQFGGI